MKIVRFRHDGKEAYGVLTGNDIAPITGDVFGEHEIAGELIARGDVRILAPVHPRKLVCVGLNYVLHAKECNLALPEEPMIFMCSPAAVIADGDAIRLDSSEDRIDFEAEIAIVVGKKAKDVTAADARNFILGYTCANDVSNRDLQKKDGQFTRAKSFDTYKPIGPWIETDLDPSNLAIQLWQNGELRQSSTTSDMIFSTDTVFEFISHIMTLEPGDVILTGTPSGIAPMRSGDSIEVEIEGIGRLTNTVV